MTVTARTLCWFSAGAASAVATKLALAVDPTATIATIDTGSEHPDRGRFVDACEEWFERPVIRLKSDRYPDTWSVWEARRFIVSHHGAPCTIELKKRVRHAFERPDDRQVFGYTADGRDAARARRFLEQNPGVDLWTPLIERQLTKSDCLALLDRVGIALPALYLLGYQNANCLGCPRGGIGYWNKIRQDFPAVFDRMARLERDLGHAVLSDHDGPVWLDQLDPNRGDHASEPSFDCSLSCAAALTEIGE